MELPHSLSSNVPRFVIGYAKECAVDTEPRPPIAVEKEVRLEEGTVGGKLRPSADAL